MWNLHVNKTLTYLVVKKPWMWSYPSKQTGESSHHHGMKVTRMIRSRLLGLKLDVITKPLNGTATVIFIYNKRNSFNEVLYLYLVDTAGAGRWGETDARKRRHQEKATRPRDDAAGIRRLRERATKPREGNDDGRGRQREYNGLIWNADFWKSAQATVVDRKLPVVVAIIPFEYNRHCVFFAYLYPQCLFSPLRT